MHGVFIKNTSKQRSTP